MPLNKLDNFFEFFFFIFKIKDSGLLMDVMNFALNAF